MAPGALDTLIAFEDRPVAGGDLQREWEELAERTGAAPFLHPGWIGAWAHAFGDGPASVVAVRRGDRLAGLAPFLAGRTATSSPTNWHTPQFGLLAEDRSAREELARLLLERAPHRLDVGFLESGSDDLAALELEALRAGWRTTVRPMQRSPYVSTDGDWDAYRERIGAKRLRELRRRRRKLAREGTLSTQFVAPSEGDRFEGLLAEGFAVEGSGWKAARGTAILSCPEVRVFYEEVARWAASRGWLELAFLRVGGRVAAFDLCLRAGGSIYVLKGGYDTELRAFAPRTILLHASLKRAFAQGMRSYEFLGSDEKYKMPWATGTRDMVRLQAFPRSPTGTAGYLAWRHGRPAAKRALELAGSLRERLR